MADDEGVIKYEWPYLPEEKKNRFILVRRAQWYLIYVFVITNKL